MPPTTACVDPEVVEQAEAVARRVPVGEGLAVELGLAEAPLVPGDHAELVAERLDLRREHLAVHQEAVAEDHRCALAAAVLEAEPLAVHVRVGHGRDSMQAARRGAGSSVDNPRSHRPATPGGQDAPRHPLPPLRRQLRRGDDLLPAMSRRRADADAARRHADEGLPALREARPDDQRAPRERAHRDIGRRLDGGPRVRAGSGRHHSDLRRGELGRGDPDRVRQARRGRERGALPGPPRDAVRNLRAALRPLRHPMDLQGRPGPESPSD